MFRLRKPRKSDLWWLLPGTFAVWIGIVRMLVGARNPTGLWVSDSRFYLYYSLVWSGMDDKSALAAVTSFFDGMGVRLPPGMTLDQLTNFPLFAGRPLYSLLSAPLVGALGYGGMFVVPILAYVAFIPLFYVAIRSATQAATRTLAPLAVASAFILFLLVSPTIYLIRPLAESLAVAGMAAWACTLPWRGELSRRRLWTMVAIVVVAGLSRQLTLFIAVPVICLWLWARRHQPEPVARAWRQAAIASVAATVVTTLIAQLFGGVGASVLIEAATGSKADPTEAVLFYFGHLGGQFAAEVVNIAYDPGSLILFTVSVLGMVLMRGTIVPPLVGGALLGYLGTFLVVPFATNMRLLLPTMVLMAIGAAITFSAAQHNGMITVSPDRRRRLKPAEGAESDGAEAV